MAKNHPDLQTGDAWQLQLKLKRNNGYQNLGGFDYEQWLFYKQIKTLDKIIISHADNDHIGGLADIRSGINTHLKGNNASCVLKVSTDKFSVLLSADI